MLFPDKTSLPRLEDPAAQLGVLNLLADLYVNSGQPAKAAALYKLDATEMRAQRELDEMAKSLGKRGDALLQMGDLENSHTDRPISLIRRAERRLKRVVNYLTVTNSLRSVRCGYRGIGITAVY